MLLGKNHVRQNSGNSNEPAPHESCEEYSCFGPKCPKTLQLNQQSARTIRQMFEIEASKANLVRGGLARWQLKNVVAYIDAHINRTILLDELAKETKLSTKHFARVFRQSTGVSPHRWILLQRIQHAGRLLCESDHAIAIVAGMCGFADQSHLTARFRQLMGTTPAAFRKQARRNPDGLRAFSSSKPAAFAILESR